jgi:hypothetical protein
LLLLLLAGCAGAATPFTPPLCATDAGTTTLWTADQWIGGMAAIDGGVLVGSFSGIEQVTFSGPPMSLTASPAEEGVLVVDGSIYFLSDDGLFSIPLQGGAPVLVTGGPLLVSGAQATDGTRFFLPGGLDEIDAILPGGGLSAISLGATSPGQYQFNAMAYEDGWLYAAAVDLSQGLDSLTNGAILRIPTGGGATQQLLTGIGHPGPLAVGSAGIFWAEAGTTAPFYSGVGSIRRANLDGSSPTTLLPVGAASLALSEDTLLYGGADGTIGAIRSDGSDPVTLATGLLGPQVIVSGGNVVWFSPGGGEPLSGGPVQTVQTACIPQ